VWGFPFRLQVHTRYRLVEGKVPEAGESAPGFRSVQPHPRRVRGICPSRGARAPQLCSQLDRRHLQRGKGTGLAPWPCSPTRNPPPRSPTSLRERASLRAPCPWPRRVPAPVQPLLPAVFIRGRRAEAEASSSDPVAVAAACTVAAAAASRQLA
jgi:hypothetical protein